MEEYRPAILMAVEDSIGLSPEEITEEIIRVVRLAERMTKPRQAPGLARLQAAQPSRILPATAPMRAATQTVQRQAVAPASAFTGVEPPVAGASYAQDKGEAVDLWASRPGATDGPDRLRDALARELPGTIEITVAGVPTLVTLVRHLESPGSPMMFVQVRYAIAGQSIGPQVTVFTKDKTFFPDEIVTAIKEQAAAHYSKEKKAIQARPGLPIPMPSDSDIARLAIIDGDSVSGAEAALARQDAEAWRASRGSAWSAG